MTDHQLVICQNDYPIGVLPAGSTHNQAVSFCKELGEKYEADRRKQGSLGRAAYFHWHEVPVMEKLS